MKCPKCQYLGFDAGGRCKNCGYDFSLISDASGAPAMEIELSLRGLEQDEAAPSWDDSFVSEPEPRPVTVRETSPVPERHSRPVADRESEPPAAVVARFPTDRKLPLFPPTSDPDDEPLIKLPVAPRPPLAVRRSADPARLRAVPRRPAPADIEPALQFVDEAPAPVAATAPAGPRLSALVNRTAPSEPASSFATCSRPMRLVALALDHLVLTGIDLTVVYLTVRMAGLPLSSWTDLPIPPLGAFLLLLKLAYFWAFTAVGGQTIGKMATHIRVVTEENQALEPGAAAARACAAVLSAAVCGLGYLPALVGSDPRTLHDRLARTRVVAQPRV